MFDVSGVADQRHQLTVHSQLQYRGAGALDTAGLDFLFDIYSLTEIQEPLITRIKYTDE